MRDLGKAITVGLCVFLLSLPLMYAIRNFAVFSFGMLVWFVPWLIGLTLWPQGALGGFIATEFDGAAYGFVLFGSLQNGLMGAMLAYAVLAARRHADAMTRGEQGDDLEGSG